MKTITELIASLEERVEELEKIIVRRTKWANIAPHDRETLDILKEQLTDKRNNLVMLRALEEISQTSPVYTTAYGTATFALSTVLQSYSK